MKQGIFSGCGTALVTPFLMDGSVDWDSLDRLVEAQLAGGVSPALWRRARRASRRP